MVQIFLRSIVIAMERRVHDNDDGSLDTAKVHCLNSNGLDIAKVIFLAIVLIMLQGLFQWYSYYMTTTRKCCQQLPGYICSQDLSHQRLPDLARDYNSDYVDIAIQCIRLAIAWISIGEKCTGCLNTPVKWTCCSKSLTEKLRTLNFFSKCVKLVPNLTHFEKKFQGAL